MMSKYVSIVAGVAIIAYPLAVYWGVSSFGIGSAALFIACLFIFRFCFPPVSSALSKYSNAIRFLAVIGFTLAILSWLMHDALWFRYYPVAVNLIFLVLFGFTLFKPPSMIERFARLKEPDLPESGVKYTKKVTLVWVVFFICNGMVALYTVLIADFEVWTLYNGFISYLFIGLLAAGEYCFRRYYLKRL